MIPNDEPVYEDALDHYRHACLVGHRILACNPPYVIGVSGAWGAGKTSFLRKLWAYLGGSVEWPNGKVRSLDKTERLKWFGENQDKFETLKRKQQFELIWFNPWHHQFEASPLMALLHEIRQHFSLKRKFVNEAGKLTNVAIHATLNTLASFGKELKIPIPSAKGILERGREYETEHFSTALSSQLFRDFFEGAIETVAGKDRRLVIFIDDLDRCEGDVAFRLIEALKLYLNASNCVYVLGLDQQHLESSIARTLSGEIETWRYRPLARDYLGKMFQGLFALPVPRNTAQYILGSLDPDDQAFAIRLDGLFGLKDWTQLAAALDQNLPHNPRKIKAFVSSWKLYVDTLPDLTENLDWRLTVILLYLSQFEEPLFRKVEEAPKFYNDHIVSFCKTGHRSDPLIDDGLELPYEMLKLNPVASQSAPSSDEKGGFGTPAPISIPAQPASPAIGGPADNEAGAKRTPQPRIFWISRLVSQLASEAAELNEQTILRHLPHTGGAPLAVVQGESS